MRFTVYASEYYFTEATSRMRNPNLLATETETVDKATDKVTIADDYSTYNFSSVICHTDFFSQDAFSSLSLKMPLLLPPPVNQQQKERKTKQQQ